MKYAKNQYKETYVSTVGLDSVVKDLKINEEDVRLYIMDTRLIDIFETNSLEPLYKDLSKSLI